MAVAGPLVAVFDVLGRAAVVLGRAGGVVGVGAVCQVLPVFDRSGVVKWTGKTIRTKRIR